MGFEIFREKSDCGYFKDLTAEVEYFFAQEWIDKKTLNELLETGWRKFGRVFFRDSCAFCRKCLPIRVPVDLFAESKSQKRLLKKNQSIQIKISELQCSPEIFEIYQSHSKSRFSKNAVFEEFYNNFYQIANFGIQAEYYVEGKLAGVGFLDYAQEALSTVYFIYKEEYAYLGLGNYSILKEIELTKNLGLKYYYLGYYVPGNKTMEYKNRFFPNQKMNWETGEWFQEEKSNADF